MNLYVTALSNVHAHTPPPTPPFPHADSPKPPQDGQTGGRHAQGGQNASGGGCVGDIDSMSTVLGERERRGQRRFPYKANSRAISSHVLSGDLSLFSFFLFLTLSLFSFPPTLSVAFVLSFIFIPLKAKKKGEKNKVDKGCPPSSQQREGWGGEGGSTDSSPEDRPESRDIPQCS